MAMVAGTSVRHHQRGVSVLHAVAMRTPVHMSQRRILGVARLPIASRRMRSASSRSTSGPTWVGTLSGGTTSPSCSTTAGRWVPRPGTSQANRTGIEARSVMNVSTSAGTMKASPYARVAVAELAEHTEVSAVLAQLQLHGATGLDVENRLGSGTWGIAIPSWGCAPDPSPSGELALAPPG